MLNTEAMDIKLEKLGLIEWITKINDTAIIQKLVGIKKANPALQDWSDKLSQEEIDSVNRGLKDIEEGNLQSHESVRKIYEKYL